MRAILALWTAFVAAAARAGDGYAPAAEKHSLDWVALVIAVVALIAVCAIAFKSSKRTHLD